MFTEAMIERVRGIRFGRDHRWAPSHLSASLDGDLGRHAERRLTRHIHDCPECRAALRGLQRMLERIRSVSVTAPEPPPDIAAAVRARLHEPPA